MTSVAPTPTAGARNGCAMLMPEGTMDAPVKILSLVLGTQVMLRACLVPLSGLPISSMLAMSVGAGALLKKT